VPKLAVFNNVSLDGYFVDHRGDMTWANASGEDAEWRAFVANNASRAVCSSSEESLTSSWRVIGRHRGYQERSDCGGTNEQSAKIVFSRTLDSVSWNNTKAGEGRFRRRKCVG